MKIPPDPTPCYAEDPEAQRALNELFEATDLTSHREARELCGGCYFADKCRQLASELAHDLGKWAGAPAGTWGGELYVKGQRKTVRS